MREPEGGTKRPRSSFLLPLETRDATGTVTVSKTLLSPDEVERLDDEAKRRNTKEELDGTLAARMYQPLCARVARSQPTKVWPEI